MQMRRHKEVTCNFDTSRQIDQAVGKERAHMDGGSHGLLHDADGPFAHPCGPLQGRLQRADLLLGRQVVLPPCALCDGQRPEPVDDEEPARGRGNEDPHGDGLGGVVHRVSALFWGIGRWVRGRRGKGCRQTSRQGVDRGTLLFLERFEARRARSACQKKRRASDGPAAVFFLVGKLKRSFGRGELDRVVRKDRRALWREPTLVTRGVLQLVHGGSWFFCRHGSHACKGLLASLTTPTSARFVAGGCRYPPICILSTR